MSPGVAGGLTPSKLLSIIWLVTAIAVTLVVSRFAIRLFIAKKTAVDNVLVSDLLVLVALATLITMAGLYCQIIPTIFDLDLAAAHKPPLSPETMLQFEDRADYYLRVQFGIIILFWTCVWAVKLSVLVFYKSLLGVNRKQKAGLAALFSLGFFIIAIALVRVFQTRATKTHQADPIWLALWSQIEASVAVVVSCLPSFGWLLNKRARSESAYKRRNPSSSGRSISGIRSPTYPAEAMRLETIRQGTFLNLDS
ncbi:MAG: hypothetical protein Q9161_008274 [Pseudevernia consocians]